MDYKAVFLDIDGTILKDDKTYTESTKEAIRQLKSKGVGVFFSTGRPLHELEELANELGIESAIGYNGAYAVHQNKVILDEPMNQELVQQILALAEKYNNDLVLYTTKKTYLTNLELVKFIGHFQLLKIQQYPKDSTEPIYGITAINVLPEHVPFYKELHNLHVSPVLVGGMRNTYDLIQGDLNKGEAVKKVCALLDIQKEQAIAFGDGTNDKEMFEAVEESFVMANGNPAVFPYAKHKTTSVDESGIFNGLKKLGLVE